MAKIPRKTQKIFAANATNNGVFGSAADGTKVTTTDLDVIQSKAAYLLGWLSATIGLQNLPTLEEEQGLHFMETQQLAYIFQEGIPEFDLGTTYNMNSIVKKPSSYQLYGSVTDNNVGHALTDVANWKLLVDLNNLSNKNYKFLGSGNASLGVNATPQTALTYSFTPIYGNKPIRVRAIANFTQTTPGTVTVRNYINLTANGTLIPGGQVNNTTTASGTSCVDAIEQVLPAPGSVTPIVFNLDVVAVNGTSNVTTYSLYIEEDI